MKKCKSCQKEIDSKAKKCPYCQTDQRNWFVRHPILSVLLILIAFGLIASIGGNKNSNTATTSNNSQTENKAVPEVKPTPIIVDATTIVGEYDKNKLAAQDKYTGKIIQTTAVIKNISGGELGDYYLSLMPTNDEYYFGTTIQCFFKDKSVLTPLTNGQSVTVAGTMEDMTLGIVGMKDCNLIK